MLGAAVDAAQVASVRGFFALVRSAFASRRKMLRNNLQPANGGAEVEAALARAGLPATARAQEVSLDQFVQLYGMLGAPWTAAVAGGAGAAAEEEEAEEGEGLGGEGGAEGAEAAPRTPDR